MAPTNTIAPIRLAVAMPSVMLPKTRHDQKQKDNKPSRAVNEFSLTVAALPVDFCPWAPRLGF